MYKIYYHTHKGNETIRVLDNLTSVAERLESLFKARIKAKAFDEEGNEIGSVFKNEGHITWYCESDSS